MAGWSAAPEAVIVTASKLLPVQHENKSIVVTVKTTSKDSVN